MADNEEQEVLKTVHEIASILRVDDTTVRRWIKNGALNAVRLPHKPTGRREVYRIYPSEIRKFYADYQG